MDLLRLINCTGWAKVPLPEYLYAKSCEYYVSDDALCAVCIQSLKNGEYKIRKNTVHQGYSRPYMDAWTKKLDMDKCVWMAFNAGKWIDGIKIVHIDGNSRNCRLDNLKVESGINGCNFFYEYVDVYRKEFNGIVHYLEYTYFAYGIDREDAQDIVQDAYLYICSHIRTLRVENKPHFLNMWKWYCRYLARKVRFGKYRYISCELFEVHDAEYEFPLFSFIKNEGLPRKIIKMLQQGYSAKDISELEGIGISAVYVNKWRACTEIRQRIKNY